VIYQKLALSTTLATNAIIEKKRCPCCCFYYRICKTFQTSHHRHHLIKGGHNISGEEEEPLDIDTIVDTIQGIRNEVDAYAVCSAMSMTNPNHELVTKRPSPCLIPNRFSCSHNVSQHTGMLERASTAALHAKLMPLMEDFIEGVQAAMVENDLDCPVFLITGNGSRISITKDR